jgi:hypothetical protein
VFARGEPISTNETKGIDLMKNWENQIAGCFSVVDCKFASQYYDVERAREMLIAALQQGVGYKEFCKAIRKWLRDQLATANSQVAKDRLKIEMKKVRKLASYFQP